MATDDTLTASNSSLILADEITTVFEDLNSTPKLRPPIDVQFQGDRMYICVCTSSRNTFQAHEMRKAISKILGFPSIRLMQIVGDSGLDFSSEGSDRASKVLNEHVSSGTILEYGLTSQGRDSAWVVGKCLSANTTSGICGLGNVVSASVGALRNGWTASSLTKIFTVLYNASGTPTTFGDDTWLSDGLMDASFGDQVICLEGGAQSFHQAVSVLVNNIPVVMCTGLRNDEQKFSAAALLLKLRSVSPDDDKSFTRTLEIYLSACAALSEVNRQKIRDDANQLRALATLHRLVVEA